MKDLIKSKIFISTFLTAYFLFFIITVCIFDFKRKSFGAGNFDYGFPFAYYHSNCFGGDYLWTGLVNNILFAAFLSFGIGLASVIFWRKVSSPEFRKKWYL